MHEPRIHPQTAPINPTAIIPHPTMPPPPQNQQLHDTKEKYRLEAEDDNGDCEYKWRLTGITSVRFEHLVTQMNFRVSEGHGKCLYEIGVHDDGTAKGLDDADFEESIGVVRRMAAVLSFDVAVVAVQDVTPTAQDLLAEHQAYLAKRRTTIESQLARNRKLMLGPSSGSDAPTTPTTSTTPPAGTSSGRRGGDKSNGNILYQKQYERRHDELSDALRCIANQEQQAQQQQQVTTERRPHHPAHLTTQPKRMRCAEILVTRRPAQVSEVRIVLCGEEGGGKSTLVGVLTQGHLDDGQGSARSSVFSHRHELSSGRTSTLASHSIGFSEKGEVTNYHHQCHPTTGSSGSEHRHPDASLFPASATRSTKAPPPQHHDNDLRPVTLKRDEAISILSSRHNKTFPVDNSLIPDDRADADELDKLTAATLLSTAKNASSSKSPSSLLSSTAASLADRSMKLVSLLDIGGSAQYARTAFFGITSRNPGYVALVADATKLVDGGCANGDGGDATMAEGYSGMGAKSTSAHFSIFHQQQQHSHPSVGDGCRNLDPASGGGDEDDGGLSDGIFASPLLNGDTMGTATGVNYSSGATSRQAHPSPAAEALTPAMRRLDRCLGQYVAICCVAKIPFFLVLAKTDEVGELEMDDLLYDVDAYFTAATQLFAEPNVAGCDDNDASSGAQIQELANGEAARRGMRTITVTSPEGTTLRNLLIAAASKQHRPDINHQTDTSQEAAKGAMEVVVRAVVGCVTRTSVPVFPVSSVTGEGIEALKAFFHQLPVQHNNNNNHNAPSAHVDDGEHKPAVTEANPSQAMSPAAAGVVGRDIAAPHGNDLVLKGGGGEVEVLLEGAFYVPDRNVGVVLAGLVNVGCVRLGDSLCVGPDRFGGFYPAKVLSIHTQPAGSHVSYLGEGSHGTFAIGHYGSDFCQRLEERAADDDDAIPNSLDGNREEGGGHGSGEWLPAGHHQRPHTTTNIFDGSAPYAVAPSSAVPSTHSTASTPCLATSPAPDAPLPFPVEQGLIAEDVGSDQKAKVHHSTTLLHPHLLRTIPVETLVGLLSDHAQHLLSSPSSSGTRTLSAVAGRQQQASSSKGSLISSRPAFPVGSFFFGRKGAVLVSSPPLESSAVNSVQNPSPERLSPSMSLSPSRRFVAPSNPPGLCFGFTCHVHVLPRRRRRLGIMLDHQLAAGGGPPMLMIHAGQEPVIHCRNVRQAARVVSCEYATQQRGNSTAIAEITCEFLFFPEVLAVGAVVLFRSGRAVNAVGTITRTGPVGPSLHAPSGEEDAGCVGGPLPRSSTGSSNAGSVSRRASITGTGSVAPTRFSTCGGRQMPLVYHNRGFAVPPRSPVVRALSPQQVAAAAAASFSSPSLRGGPCTVSSTLMLPPPAISASPIEQQMLMETLLLEGAPGAQEPLFTLNDFNGDDGGAGLQLFADDDEDRKGRKKPRGMREPPPTPAATTTAVAHHMDPDQRRLEHECKRLSRAERRARHYGVLLAHKLHKEEKMGEEEGRRSSNGDSGSPQLTARLMSIYARGRGEGAPTTPSTSPPLTPDTGNNNRGTGGSWGAYDAASNRWATAPTTTTTCTTASGFSSPSCPTGMSLQPTAEFHLSSTTAHDGAAGVSDGDDDGADVDMM